MIIYVGDYWIDGALLAVVGGFLIIGGALWWRSRKLRANKAALTETKGKESATPIASGRSKCR